VRIMMLSYIKCFVRRYFRDRRKLSRARSWIVCFKGYGANRADVVLCFVLEDRATFCAWEIIETLKLNKKVCLFYPILACFVTVRKHSRV
jgi:hypothetical protein